MLRFLENVPPLSVLPLGFEGHHWYSSSFAKKASLPKGPQAEALRETPGNGPDRPSLTPEAGHADGYSDFNV